MEMPRDSRRCSDERDKFFGHVLRFDGTEAQLLQRRLVQNPSYDVRELDPRHEVTSVGSQIDAAENDLFRASCKEPPNFIDHHVWRQTATATSDERDHTVGAAVVATVLDLQDRPRAICNKALGTFDLHCLHRRLRENIASENFRGAACERHGFVIEPCERNEILRPRAAGVSGRCRRFASRHQTLSNNSRDFGLMRIADHPGDAIQRGQLFGSALRVTSSYYDPRRGIRAMNLADGIARLRIRSGRDRASVQHHDVGAGMLVEHLQAAGAQGSPQRSSIRFRGATAKILDEKRSHKLKFTTRKKLSVEDYSSEIEGVFNPGPGSKIMRKLFG